MPHGSENARSSKDLGMYRLGNSSWVLHVPSTAPGHLWTKMGSGGGEGVSAETNKDCHEEGKINLAVTVLKLHVCKM